MKNLSRMNLSDVVVLDDLQMKLVKGGFNEAVNEIKDDSKCSSKCSSNSDCGGLCSKCVENPNWNWNLCEQ